MASASAGSELKARGDTRAMEAFGRGNSAAWAAGLSPAERAVLTDYSHGGYQRVNAVFRGVGRSASAAKDAGILKRALDRARTAGAVLAYRSVPGARSAFGLDPRTLRRGSVFSEPSAASMSLSRRESQKFLGFSPTDALLRVHVPKGARAAYLNAGGLSGHRSERELLVAPGSAKYRVRSVRHTGRGSVIDVDLIR